MFSEKLPSTLNYLVRESGLLSCPKFYLDRRFMAALFAGWLVIWLAHDWYPVFSERLSFHWQVLISLVLWQPLLEELLFRGIVQGQFRKFDWGQHQFFKITIANGLTSLLFVGVHMINSLPSWSLSIFIPSLLFGYFRDTFNSIYPAFALHSTYNAMVIIALVTYGDAVIKPFFS